jgi:hypothetical protein
MAPDEQGVIAGCGGGEWLISASTADEVLTPLNVKARKKTKVGCALVEPIRAGSTLILVQKGGRQFYEYLTDAFTQRYSARLLNKFALHLNDIGSPLYQLAYSGDPVPLVWAITGYPGGGNDSGKIYACTYRRLSRWATEAPDLYAWHRHTHGAGKLFESIASATGSLNPPYYGTVMAMTTDDIVNVNKPRYIEVLMPPVDVSLDTPLLATFTDETLSAGAIFAGDNLAGGGGGGGTGASGKYYFEVKFNNTALSSHGSLAFGFAGQGVNQSGVGCGVWDPEIAVVTSRNGNGNVIIAGTELGSGSWYGYSDGDLIAFAIDTGARKFWVKNVTHSSSWAPGDPVAGTGGFSTAGLTTTGGIFIWFMGNGFSGTDKVNLNTDGTPAFTGAVPSGYAAWGTTAWSNGGHSTYLIGPHLAGNFQSVQLVFNAPDAGYHGGCEADVTTTITGGPQTDTTNGTVPFGTLIWDEGHVFISASSTDSSDVDLNAGWSAAWLGVYAYGGKASP